MIKKLKASQISLMIKRLGLKPEDIIITDPKAELLSGITRLAKDEVISVIESSDLSQIEIINPESL